LDNADLLLDHVVAILADDERVGEWAVDCGEAPANQDRKGSGQVDMYTRTKSFCAMHLGHSLGHVAGLL
jgi:hypothetical protein